MGEEVKGRGSEGKKENPEEMKNEKKGNLESDGPSTFESTVIPMAFLSCTTDLKGEVEGRRRCEGEEWRRRDVSKDEERKGK
jgi:hypothetical protein